jgi:hypothetical protein
MLGTMTVIRVAAVPLLDRGGGITTIPLITHRSDDTALITTGISTYPRGTAGQRHAFRNKGDEPMRILWIYPTQEVTRTLMSTGETVAHLSDDDLMGA